MGAAGLASAGEGLVHRLGAGAEQLGAGDHHHRDGGRGELLAQPLEIAGRDHGEARLRDRGPQELAGLGAGIGDQDGGAGWHWFSGKERNAQPE